MILHLMASSTPTTWSIVAVYRSGYGIAHNAAASWNERSIQSDLESPGAHLVMELTNRDGAWAVKRQDLIMSDRYLNRQEHDERPGLFQPQSSPFPLDAEIVDTVTEAIRRTLTDFGYLIPRAEWKRRYPGQHIIAEHFRAFFDADREHRASGIEGDMPFELRWTQFMPAPKGFVWPFAVRADEDRWIVTCDGEPYGSLNPSDETEARLIVRMLNSGYRAEDLPALLSDSQTE